MGAAGQRRREDALRAAVDLIREEGHQNVTVREVATAIGVTEAAVFYHFPTKEHLLVEVLRYREEHSEELALPLDAIDIIAGAVERSATSPEFVALFAEMASRAIDPTHPAHAFFAQRYVDLEAYVAQAAQARDPGLTQQEASERAAVFIAVTDGLQRRWLVHREVDMGRLARLSVDSIFGTAPLADSEASSGK